MKAVVSHIHVVYLYIPMVCGALYIQGYKVHNTQQENVFRITALHNTKWFPNCYFTCLWGHRYEEYIEILSSDDHSIFRKNDLTMQCPFKNSLK